MSISQNANFDNQRLGKKTALVCKADFACDFCLDGRSAIRRLAVDVKHARRPCEISGAGVRVNPVNGTEQARRHVKDTDVVSLQDSFVGRQGQVISERKGRRVGRGSKGTGEICLGCAIESSTLRNYSARRAIAVIDHAEISFCLFAIADRRC